MFVPTDKKDGAYEVSLPHTQIQGETVVEEAGESGEMEEEEEEGKEESSKVSSAVTVFRFIMKQSYICALIAMMVSGPVDFADL